MVRHELWLLSGDGRHFSIPGILLWLIVVTQIQFAYLAVDRLTPIKLGCRSVQRGQRPTPTGEFTGDRDVGHHVMLFTFVEPTPLLMQSAVAGVSAVLERGSDVRPAGAHSRSGIAVGRSVVPGRLNQQPSHVSVAGLGDRTLNP